MEQDNQTTPQEQPPAQPDMPAPEEVDKDQTVKATPPMRKQTSLGLAVGVAILIALVLVLVGVLAYQKSGVDTTPDDDSTTETTDSDETTPPTDLEVQNELDSIDASLDELDTQVDELGDPDLTDEALELE